MKRYKIAVLDDYQTAALESADWSILRDRADITVFQDPVDDADAVVARLLPFDMVCVMRERTPLPRSVIERLPNLKLISSTLGHRKTRISGSFRRGCDRCGLSDPSVETRFAKSGVFAGQ
jgi:hypothetical protein